MAGDRRAPRSRATQYAALSTRQSISRPLAAARWPPAPHHFKAETPGRDRAPRPAQPSPGQGRTALTTHTHSPDMSCRGATARRAMPRAATATRRDDTTRRRWYAAAARCDVTAAAVRRRRGSLPRRGVGAVWLKPQPRQPGSARSPAPSTGCRPLPSAPVGSRVWGGSRRRRNRPGRRRGKERRREGERAPDRWAAGSATRLNGGQYIRRTGGWHSAQHSRH